MRLCLCTLILNEKQWIEKLYEQHKAWKGLVKWIFVESADRVYAQTNPHMVSKEGLSVDGTTEYLEKLASEDEHVVHIKHGFCTSQDPAQGKCEARNRYLNEMESVEPDFFLVLDADEFYTYEVQEQINNLWAGAQRKEALRHPDITWSICLKHREIWHPPFFQQFSSGVSRFSYEVVGGFWSIPYCRIWKWFPDLRYLNHNTPSLNAGASLDRHMKRLDSDPNSPQMTHLGFASKLETRAAKNRYYEERGEKVDRRRSWYCESRKAFETWTPDTVLPKGAKVIQFTGPIPECFLVGMECFK